MKDLLRELGHFRVEDSFAEICESAIAAANSAGTPNGFPALPSFIPVETSSTKRDYTLVIDIGGTSTKSAIRICKKDSEEWIFLFERMNSDFTCEREGCSCLERFFHGLGQAIQERLQKLSLSTSSVDACCLVWSNAQINTVEEDGSIGAVVTLREEGYNKGEWFIRDLKNGDDIGNIFRGSVSEFGFGDKPLIISNDTVLTMKSLDGADAGLINSTGLNGTIIISEDNASPLVLCNAELGGNFLLDPSLFSDADILEGNQKAKTIENLVSGKFVPELFNSHISSLAEKGAKEFTDIAAFLSDLGEKRYEEFGMKDTSHTFLDPKQFIANRSRPELFTESALSSLQVLSRALISRSAKLAALAAYFTITNRIDQKDTFKIAVDSRLARHIPLYEEIMRKQFQDLIPRGKSAEMVLVDPLETSSGRISVPMLGGARATDCLS